MVFDPSVDSNWLGISLSHFICLCVFNTTHSSFNHLTAESCRLPKGGHMFFVQIQQSIFLLYNLCVCVCGGVCERRTRERGQSGEGCGVGSVEGVERERGCVCVWRGGLGGRRRRRDGQGTAVENERGCGGVWVCGCVCVGVCEGVCGGE